MHFFTTKIKCIENMKKIKEKEGMESSKRKLQKSKGILYLKLQMQNKIFFELSFWNSSG